MPAVPVSRGPVFESLSTGQNIPSMPDRTTSKSTAGKSATTSSCLQLVQQLAAFSRQLRRQLADCVRGTDLNETQFLLLWLCASAEGPGPSQRQMADQLGLSTGQVSGLVEQLRERGLLDCHRPKEDRRRQVWQLTSQGEQLIADLEVPLDQWSDSVVLGSSNLLQEDLLQTLLLLSGADATFSDESTQHVNDASSAAQDENTTSHSGDDISPHQCETRKRGAA